MVTLPCQLRKDAMATCIYWNPLFVKTNKAKKTTCNKFERQVVLALPVHAETFQACCRICEEPWGSLGKCSCYRWFTLPDFTVAIHCMWQPKTKDNTISAIQKFILKEFSLWRFCYISCLDNVNILRISTNFCTSWHYQDMHLWKVMPKLFTSATTMCLAWPSFPGTFFNC